MFTPIGKTRLESLPYGDYRNLRWTLGQLAAGGVTEVAARVRVLTSTLPVVVPTANAAHTPAAAISTLH